MRVYVYTQSLSCVQLFGTPWAVAHQAPLSMEFSGKNTGWVAIPSSRGSFWPRDRTRVSCISCIGRQILYHLSHLESPKALFTPCLIIFQKPWSFLWARNKPFSALGSDSIIHFLQSLYQPTENGQEYKIVIYLNILYFGKGLNST